MSHAKTCTLLYTILMITVIVAGGTMPALASSTTDPGTFDSISKTNLADSLSTNSLAQNNAIQTLASGLALEEPDPNTPGVTFFGHGGYSADALGQDGGGGTIQAQIPAGSTIEHAYLFASMFCCTPQDLEIVLDGQDYHLNMLPNNQHSFLTPYKYTGVDLKNQVAAKFASSGPGIINFVVNNDPDGVDGVALVVIYSNPSLPETSIAVLDGGLPSEGASTTLGLGAPLDKTVPGFTSTLSLGIGFSFQDNGDFVESTAVNLHQCGGGQQSNVDINGQRLTSCAGNFDDGYAGDGGLITVGGVGDSTDNPPNPSGTGGNDDELYNIAPFLNNGITQINLNTVNPSGDDMIFLAIYEITARVSVGEICGDGIDNDGDGQIDEGCKVNIISSTTATSRAPVGGQAHDSAVLGGKDVPQGTITFRAYLNDNTCSIEIAPVSTSSTPPGLVFTSIIEVDGSGTYTSEDYITQDLGTLYWTASYSGDENNDPFTTACNDPGEKTLVGNISNDDGRPPPPSMSGNGQLKISDGFTVGGDSYAVSGNLIDIPTHRLIMNVPQSIVVKTYSDSALGFETTHISLNIGPHPMSSIMQSILSITWDKTTGVQVTDPQGFVTNVSVNKQTDGKIDTFTFTFTPLKDLPTSDILVRAWNNYLASNDFIMTNAVKFSGEFLSPAPFQLPSTIKVYDNISDLKQQLTSDGYDTPRILSHIHDTSSVFVSTSGQVNWYYDTKDKTVSLVLEDGNGKVLSLQLEKLVAQAPQAQNTNYLIGDTYYSHHSLSRTNVDELETVKAAEQLKALNMMVDLYGWDYVMQYNLLGQ